VEIKETKAKLEMLNNKVNALILILNKEGITTKEEVDEAVNDIIQGDAKND
jgi:hypothetical protein